MDYIEMNERIVKLMKKSNLTKISLSEKLGISRSGYDQMIKNGSIKVSVLDQLAAVLNTSVTYLMYGDEKSLLHMTTSEPEPTYETKKYLEDRVDTLERQMAILLKK